MSFADEIRNQAKTKEQVVRETAEEAVKQDKQQWERFKVCYKRNFDSMTATIKKRISEAAQSGNYWMDGGERVIKDTFVVHLNHYWYTHPDIYFFADSRNEVVCQVLQRKDPWFGMPKSLVWILLKAKYPDEFKSAYNAFMDGLRRDGIDATFILEWGIPYKYISCAYAAGEYSRRVYQIPWEQLSEGYTIRDWFLPPDSTINAVFKGDSKNFRCTYQFRF